MRGKDGIWDNGGRAGRWGEVWEITAVSEGSEKVKRSRTQTQRQGLGAKRRRKSRTDFKTTTSSPKRESDATQRTLSWVGQEVKKAEVALKNRGFSEWASGWKSRQESTKRVARPSRRSEKHEGRDEVDSKKSRNLSQKRNSV